AFLLRTTAQEASSAGEDAPHSGESSADEDATPRRAKKSRRIRKNSADLSKATHRGRPARNHAKVKPIQVPVVEQGPSTHEASPKPHSDSETALNVSTTTNPALKKQQPKPSPSSSSDVVHMSASAFAGPSEERRHCALCCDYETAYEASFSDAALFLCPACDQKYPTQQALGRVCMT
ncbi:hypothetical protein BBJ28_00024985, partial [Nothophytophthora sp. Chile5]